jgi:hypothetical protein
MLATMSEAEILAQIDEWQGIQKRHPPKHPVWQKASRILRELYAEMSKRTKK